MHGLLQFIQRHKLYVIIPICVVIVYGAIAALLYITDSKTFKGESTYSGISVENLSVDQAYEALAKHLADTPVTIQAESSTLQTTADKLGAEVERSVVDEHLQQQRLWYSLFPFIYKKNFTLPLVANQDILITTARSIELPADKKTPVDATVDYTDSKISILPESPGDGIATDPLFIELQRQLQEGTNEILLNATLTSVQPRVTKEALSKRLDEITTILRKEYTISDGTVNYTIPTATIAKSLYIDDTNQLKPSYSSAAAIISTATQKFAVSPVAELSYSFASGKPNSVFQTGVVGKVVSNELELISQFQERVASADTTTLMAVPSDTPFTSKTYVIDDVQKKVVTYTIDHWGSTSSVAYFREKAAETLTSNKGWTRAGIAFIEVPSSSDFTLVLAEGAELSRRYSPTCDGYYSCRVGNKVIINDARWQNATPVWPKDISSYQNLVINHETGHWLGLGHYFCSEPGALAPVMQQQSIDIRNCTYNEWPLDYEIQKLNL
jgi:hypothetical protein